MQITVPPFALLVLAVPVLLLGEQLVKRVRWLGRLNIPAPIIGGLIVALLVLFAQKISPGAITLLDRLPSVAWHWLALPQLTFDAPAAWATNPKAAPYVYQPLLILFFTCIGLNASWAVAKSGGLPLLGYFALATAFAALQYGVGIGTAIATGVDPLIGIMCSGVSLMGGFGTATSWAPDFEKSGLHGASTIGIAAAAFGVVAGGLLAGPLSGRLMERKVRDRVVPPLEPRGFEMVLPAEAVPGTPHPHDVADELVDEGGFIDDVCNMARALPATLVHLLTLAACLKIGAFLSAHLGAIQIGEQKLTFPVYMGSMIVAAVIRNVHDVAGLRFIETKHVDLIASFALAWMLSCVMITLQLGQLAALAGPMITILLAQVVLMAVFAYWVVFPLMGRNYDAAAMSAGMIGFGLGATSNAVATMRQLARRYGPSARAFLIVTVVGAFLIDFTNAFLIMGFVNWFKH